MSKVLVQLQDIAKRFGDFVAVEPLTLDIYAGEFLAIMGSSGCGKTTTLRMIAGLEAPSEGEVRLDGRVMNDVRAHERDTPMVWQTLALFPFLNARENVEFGLKMRGMDAVTRRAKAMDWLDRMEIAEFAERDVAQLSGGQRQRVALARALVTEPQILLLDEPLSALDAALVVRMQALLTRLQRELGITFVYVTHSQSEAFAMADRVVIMDNGYVMQQGSPKQIYREPANQFVAEFVGCNNILRGSIESHADGLASVGTAIGSIELAVDESMNVGDAVTFVVSADRMSVTPQQTQQSNSVLCQLISEEFVGSVITLYLETPDGTELKAQIQQRNLDVLTPEPGANLWVSWSAQHAHILPG